jgi:hypothetical protein
MGYIHKEEQHTRTRGAEEANSTGAVRNFSFKLRSFDAGTAGDIAAAGGEL